MDIDSSAAETSGTRGPSPGFLKRRHERMRNRLNGSMGTAEEEDEEQHEKAPAEEANAGFEVSLVENNCKTTKVENMAVVSTASSTAVRSFHQLREKRKNRVPGGAAAKLIGRTCTVDAEVDRTKSVEDDDDAADVPTEEFIRIRDEAKNAFEKGTKENRRYYNSDASSSHTASPEETRLEDACRVLNREKALHETPTDAVLSLIGGRETPKVFNSANDKHLNDDSIRSITSTRSNEQSHLTSPTGSKDFTKTPAVEIAPRSAFQAPPRKKVDNPTSDDEENAPSQTYVIDDMETTTKGRSPLEQPLLSKNAERRVSQMKEKMHDPSSTLSNLIATIVTPEDKTFSRGYMVRRKNACGALQVLTAKPTNRIQICWTIGVLPALSSVLEDSGMRDLAVEFPDVPTRKEFLEARKRAVSSLMNLSVPPKNRLAVFYTPGMVANLVRVIKLDQFEARKGCCAVLAHLAKSKENRLVMVQVPGLIDAITSIIEPNVIIVPPKAIEEDEDSDSSSSSGSPDQEFPLGNSSSDSASTAGELSSSGSCTSTDAPSPKKEKQEDGRYRVDMSNVPTHDPAKAAKRYDDYPNEHLHGARLNIFALLSHLVKEKDNAYILARHKFLVDTLVEISKLHDSPSHEHAVKLLAHMTRHRANTKFMVFKNRKIVPVLVKASFSQNDETRRYVCFALQNMSQDKPCRQELAITDELLTALCVRIRQASDKVERLAAIQALKNLTDEPANLIPMTNTPECLATLMQIAHAGEGTVTEQMQFLGCDALATLSHWFRSIATSGHRIDLTKRGLKPTHELFVPSLKIVSYQQWQ